MSLKYDKLTFFCIYMGNTVANLYFLEKGNTDATSKPKIISIKPELIIRGSMATSPLLNPPQAPSFQLR